ncbi:hypothetical protein CHS0354_002021 [Potamilus streckersoni]|uniref:Chorismate mutase domain-containing protein n=1 Tax=Potamilus streckersoni TaxID=2493646 RepID=A0AAE0W6S1_9BIVA|nr:hypothetical protein CHS0354_002021 [Potamilus streckersoni]
MCLLKEISVNLVTLNILGEKSAGKLDPDLYLRDTSVLSADFIRRHDNSEKLMSAYLGTAEENPPAFSHSPQVYYKKLLQSNVSGLIAVLNSRQLSVAQIASVKISAGLPLLDERRRSEIIAAKRTFAAEIDLHTETALAIFELIHDESLRYQQELTNTDRSGSGFALFRLPGETQVQYISDDCPLFIRPGDGSLPADAGGFIFAPFDPQMYPTCLLAGPPQNADTLTLERLAKILHLGKADAEKDTDESDFKASVADFSAKARTKATPADKIVLSAVKYIKLRSHFNQADYFLRICDSCPHSFVSLFYTRETGMWIGASPELLLCQTADRISVSVLAATKGEADLSDWSDKEYREFAYVRRFIEETMTEKGLMPENPLRSPDTVISGPLRHLKMTLTANTDADTDITRFLEKLHPTPAVCGYPRPEAKKLITSYEKHAREYYAGYLGIISPHYKNLYVNIRCGRILPNFLRLITGVGIIAASSRNKNGRKYC